VDGNGEGVPAGGSPRAEENAGGGKKLGLDLEREKMRRYQAYSDWKLPVRFWTSTPRDLPELFYNKYKILWNKMSMFGDGSARNGCMLYGGKFGSPSYETSRLFAAIVCKAMFVSDRQFEWLTASSLIEECKSDIRYSDSESMSNRFENVDCLVFDGFGISNYWMKNEFEYWFSKIIFSRMNNSKPTLIISGLLPSEVKKFYSPSIHELFVSISSVAVNFTEGSDVSVG
jgi:hypothetical protein